MTENETSTGVIEQLEKRFKEVSEIKQNRVEKGDDVGMAYCAGREMGLIYAIETLNESVDTDADRTES